MAFKPRSPGSSSRFKRVNNEVVPPPYITWTGDEILDGTIKLNASVLMLSAGLSWPIALKVAGTFLNSKSYVWTKNYPLQAWGGSGGGGGGGAGAGGRGGAGGVGGVRLQNDIGLGKHEESELQVGTMGNNSPYFFWCLKTGFRWQEGRWEWYCKYI